MQCEEKKFKANILIESSQMGQLIQSLAWLPRNDGVRWWMVKKEYSSVGLSSINCKQWEWFGYYY